MTNLQPYDALQECIQQSDLGVALLQHPLIEKDSWPLADLGYTEQEIAATSLRNLHFENFELAWLKQLAKLTILQRRNERHGINAIKATLDVLKYLDNYLWQSGWNSPKDLCDTLLKRFTNHCSLSNRLRIRQVVFYASRLWVEEKWLVVDYIPPKYRRETPKTETIPEEVLYQFYNNLHRLPSVLERLFRLQLALGCRIGELLKMPRGCLKQEGENWYLKRWIEKRKKWKFIQIHPSVTEVIRAQQRFLDSQFGQDSDFGYLFCWLSVSAMHTRMGYSNLKRFEIEPVYSPKLLPISTIGNWLRDFVEEVDLRDQQGERFNVTTHMFRRTKATIMAYCETEDEYIAAVLGHASLDMLPHYRKSSLERLERQAKREIYVDMHGNVSTYKPKRTRYEQLHDRIIVHTQAGECHRPSMLGDCELRYVCPKCKYHRVTLKDRPFLEKDRDNLLRDLDKAKSQGSTRKIVEISALLTVINNRLRGLEEAEIMFWEGTDG